MTEKFKICFFRTSTGREPVKEFLKSLKKSKNKNERNLFDLINNYLVLLSHAGSLLGEPFVRKLKNDVWELRPKKERILYCCINGNEIILLHHFTKKTQKTPAKDLEIALERSKLLKKSNY